MDARQPARRLRIFVNERERHGGRPLFEAIVFKARELGLVGATVFRGAMGYGRVTTLRRPSILEISEDLPILVEVVDSAEKIELLLAELPDMVEYGLSVIDDVEIVPYLKRDRAAPQT